MIRFVRLNQPPIMAMMRTLFYCFVPKRNVLCSWIKSLQEALSRNSQHFTSSRLGRPVVQFASVPNLVCIKLARLNVSLESALISRVCK